MGIILATDRLTLRRFTAEDADNLFELNSAPEVMRYLTGGKPTPHQEIRDSIIPFHLSESQGIDLGYRLRRAAWNKGYATEGSRALNRKGFTDLGVERVFAHTMTVNAASRRVLEKTGLVHVRTFPYEGSDVIEGSEHGWVEYGLSRTDWDVTGESGGGRDE
jgi:RimJ/RimL family protein N-acetyltransferase